LVVLLEGLQKIPGIILAYPTEANEIFIRLPPALLEIIDILKEKYFVLSEEPEIYRLVCSFDTEKSEIDEFLALALKTVNDYK
jgi:threonine aldolase